jgi:hypothetical protein
MRTEQMATCARSSCTDGQQQQADSLAHKNRVFLSRTAKHKAQKHEHKAFNFDQKM